MINSEYEVKLSFDSFNLSYSKDCTDDYVEIHRVKYCGSRAPSTVTLDGSDIISVTFTSSGKVKYPGFKASYSSKSEHPFFSEHLFYRVCCSQAHHYFKTTIDER